MIYTQPTNIPDSLVKNSTPTNIKITPVVVRVPKTLPKRDNNIIITKS